VGVPFPHFLIVAEFPWSRGTSCMFNMMMSNVSDGPKIFYRTGPKAY